jgi:hypothetical protein
MRKSPLPVLLVLLAIAAALSLTGGAERASADLGAPAVPTIGLFTSLNLDALLSADSAYATAPSTSDPNDDPNKLPKGSKWHLFGTAKDDVDPQNGSNEVISFDTTDPAAIAGAYRKFGDHVKINQLDNMVELKYLYVGRTCGGGSTRFQLGIDTNGDGKSDGNAFGYVGDKPGGAGGCVSNTWIYEDMTNAVAKWDLTQLGGPYASTWDEMVLYLNTVYSNHRVVNAVLVDDSGTFFAGDLGCAYFDLVSAGGRTLTDHSDTSDGHKQQNNC